MQRIAMKDKASIRVALGPAIDLRASDVDYLPLSAGIAVLGSGFTGRLMATVRDQEGLTYGIGAGLSGLSLMEGGFVVNTSFAPRCDRICANRQASTIRNRGRATIAAEARRRYAKIEAIALFHPLNGIRMTTHITIEFTEHAAEAIGEQTSTSFSYDQGAHVPQPGDFVELENSRQTFLVIGRVFSLKANYSAVKLVLDLPPSDGEHEFDPES